MITQVLGERIPGSVVVVLLPCFNPPQASAAGSVSTTAGTIRSSYVAVAHTTLLGAEQAAWSSTQWQKCLTAWSTDK